MWIETHNGTLINLNWYSSISVVKSLFNDKFEVSAFVANTGEDSWRTPLSREYETEAEAKQELKKFRLKAGTVVYNQFENVEPIYN